jgi:transaldolase
MVKIPVTKAGVRAIEESTYQGVIINGTVSFTVPQAVAVAEAVKRGLERREKEGKDISYMHPICTIMVGRTDDWMKDVVNRDGLIVDAYALEMAGVAVFKHAYRIFKERNYPARLLVAAYRNHYHWSELMGGDISMTIPPGWIKRFVGCDIKVENRMDDPVDPAVINHLEAHIPDFVKAYEEDGMTPDDFDSYGATCKTLMQFLRGYDTTIGIIRNVMLEIKK